MRKGIVRMSSGFSLKFCIFIRQSGHHGSARFPNGRNKMLSENKLFGFRPLHEMWIFRVLQRFCNFSAFTSTLDSKNNLRHEVVFGTWSIHSLAFYNRLSDVSVCPRVEWLHRLVISWPVIDAVQNSLFLWRYDYLTLPTDKKRRKKKVFL